MTEVVFQYRKRGQDCGFLTERDRFFTVRTAQTKDSSTFTSFPIDRLRVNLRTLVRNKKARVVKVGDSEAVAVPTELIDCLFLDPNEHK